MEMCWSRHRSSIRAPLQDRIILLLEGSILSEFSHDIKRNVKAISGGLRPNFLCYRHFQRGAIFIP